MAVRRPSPRKALVDVNFDMFIDRPHVRKKLSAATEWVYAKTGGYVMTAIRRSIRRPKKERPRDRAFNIYGTNYYFDKRDTHYSPRFTADKPNGMVFNWDIYASSGEIVYATTNIARVCARIYYQSKKDSLAGQPPRRGPSDLLRKFILFGYTLESLLIGPHIFDSQPGGITAGNTGTSIPDLLESGGTKMSFVMGGGFASHYNRHPYVEPKYRLAVQKFEENIEKMDQRLQG